MKMSKLFIILMAVLIVSLPTCSQKEQGGPQAVSQDPGASKTDEGIAYENMPLPSSLSAMPEVLLGTVYRDEDSFALSTFRGDYFVEGADMSDMVGLTVKITGAIREEQGKKIVKVESVEQIP